jgi:hypothetical protein
MQRGIIAGLCVAIGACCWFALRSSPVSVSLWEQVQRGPGTIVDFAAITPFAWDRVFIYGPYTPHQAIHDSLGFYWDGISRTTIPQSEGVDLVVFVNRDKVVHWFEHPCDRGDLGALTLDLTDPKGYTREEAKFLVCRVGNFQWLELVKHPRD